MMKNKLGLTLLLIAFFSGMNAQQLLIPYRKGDKFGLTDGNAKIVVEPKYDQLNWLTGKYFISTVKTPESNLHGLLYGEDEIIKPQHSLMYKVLPDMMILGILKDVSKPEKDSVERPVYVLYDKDGKEIDGARFGRLELIGTAGSKSGKKDLKRYALLYAEDFDKKTGIFVFDSDTGQIKEWFFKSVPDFKILDKSKNGDTFYLSYTDPVKGEQRKVLKLDKDYFRFEDLIGEVPKTEPVGVSKTPVTDIKSGNTEKREKKTLYREEEGRLYVKIDSIRKPLALGEGITPIFKYSKIKSQAGEMIYKKDGRFGLIFKGMVMPAKYDSMAYFGKDHFLVCNKGEKGFRCGTIDSDLKTVLEIKYDSILGVMNRFEFKPVPGTGDFELKTVKTDISLGPEEVSYSLTAFNSIVAYEDGKAFLMTIDGQNLFRYSFDHAGLNGVNLPGEIETDYVVTQRGGLYGLVFNVYDPKSGQTLQQVIEPVFKNYPAYYIKDYYGNPGFMLIGLYDKKGHFYSYASDFGVVYAD